MDTISLIALALTAVVSVAGATWYFRHAAVHGPYAVPNHRSLHQQVIPRGGGIVGAVATLTGMLLVYFGGALGLPSPWVFLGGGVALAGMGMADDRLDIAPRYRLAVQIAAAASLPVFLGPIPRLDLGFVGFALGWPGSILVLGLVVWFYNLYNFIDGTDGMASTATAFIGLLMGGALWWKGQRDLAMILGMLAVSNVGFLRYNWPPARMFMGDAGTSFIAYLLSALIWISVSRDPGVLWIWLTACVAYFSDTTTTTFTRLLTTPRWYSAHRSHAYQNLARIWNSHLRILRVVLAIDLLWALPMVGLIFVFPASAPWLTLVAYVPVVALCYKFGPRFENK